MQLKKIVTNAKNIIYTASYEGGGKVDRKDTCEEMPTPEFGEAMQTLSAVVVNVMEVHGSWINGMTVLGFTMSYTANATASMQISYNRQMGDLRKPHKMQTPMFRIDEPQDGDSGSLDIGKDLALLCHTALEQATAYAKGERSQMTFEQFNEENGALAKAESETLCLDGSLDA